MFVPWKNAQPEFYWTSLHLHMRVCPSICLSIPRVQMLVGLLVQNAFESLKMFTFEPWDTEHPQSHTCACMLYASMHIHAQKVRAVLEPKLTSGKRDDVGGRTHLTFCHSWLRNIKLALIPRMFTLLHWWVTQSCNTKGLTHWKNLVYFFLQFLQ